MDFNKLKTKEIRSMESKKLVENVGSLRKELVSIKLDVYNASPNSKTKSRNLRKVLAKMLTVSRENSALATKKKAK